jgi:tetratricopeptide (TPR) repeat protein
MGKAGQQSVQRSALVEAIEQISRALNQIATLPAIPALRREEIKLHAALITPLIYVKGYAAPQTMAAVERARLLIEQAEALSELPEDPLILFQVLFGAAIAGLFAFDRKVFGGLAAQFLSLAEKQSQSIPLVIGHRLVGHALFHTGDFTDARAHYDKGLALYDPAEHRRFARRFGQDNGATLLSYRSYARWALGYPDAALADTDQALRDAREIGHAATLMGVRGILAIFLVDLGEYARANQLIEEHLTLANEIGSAFFRVGAWRCVVHCWPEPAKHQVPSTSSPAQFQPPGQREQRCMCQEPCPSWDTLMLNLGHSMRRGDVLTNLSP